MKNYFFDPLSCVWTQNYHEFAFVIIHQFKAQQPVLVVNDALGKIRDVSKCLTISNKISIFCTSCCLALSTIARLNFKMIVLNVNNLSKWNLFQSVTSTS